MRRAWLEQTHSLQVPELEEGKEPPGDRRMGVFPVAGGSHGKGTNRGCLGWNYRRDSSTPQWSLGKTLGGPQDKGKGRAGRRSGRTGGLSDRCSCRRCCLSQV